MTEQDFKRLINFYFNYVAMDERFHKNRIQDVLRLIHHIFTININKINGRNSNDKELINAMAKSLFEKMFLSVNINDRTNPCFHYFHLGSAEHYFSDIGVNNDLVLMFLAFLGPHFLTMDELSAYFRVLHSRYTGESYVQAFSNALLSKNVSEYHSPQSIVHQLNDAALDTETALLIGLTAMASEAFQCINSGLESTETLTTLLIRYAPHELLGIIYNNIASLCRSECPSRPEHSCPAPQIMFTESGMQEFTLSILRIDLTTGLSAALSEASSSESLGYPLDYSEDSDNEGSVEESDSEHQDRSIVIQQQNELIAQLRQEL
ncbi:hypothetical protein, partial [Endozoicomonas sp. SESOKO2]|uniref:hypothetical protein n=3 Tax=unclassified Endozoicomonas TaxID=2644528 RepID=UPI0021492D1F